MGTRSAPAPDLGRLLARDYWLVMSKPEGHTTQEAIAELVPEHVTWLLGLEEQHLLLASGPLLSGPDTGPGSGISVLRAADEATARSIARDDPFVRAGLRSFDVYRWRLNEGSISVRVSLGTGRYDWH